MSASTVSAATAVLRHNERPKFMTSVLDELALTFAAAGYIAPVINGSLPGNVQSAVTILWVGIGMALW